MAFTEQVVWTACPNGAGGSGGSVRLSIHVAPRLGGGGKTTLASFPDFVGWTQRTQSFQVEIQVGANPPATVTATLDGPDRRRNDLWDALFPPTTPVHDRDAAPDYTGHRVLSYPSGRVGRFLRDRQVEAALEHPTDFPDYAWLAGKLGAIGYGAGQDQKELALRLRQLAGERDEPGPGGRPRRANDFSGASDETAFAALRAFHAPRATGTPSPITLPDLDFQQAVGLVGSHPLLMRLLGLVFDVTVPISGVTGIGATPVVATVRVLPGFSGGAGYVAVRPRTQVVVSTTQFEPNTPSSLINRRHLRLGSASAFEVQRIDVDGGALKTAFFADNLLLSRAPGKAPGQPANPAAPDVPKAYAPPTLRSAGFTVVQHERGTGFVRRVDRSKAMVDGAAGDAVPDLIADDLIRGYVLDVFDDVTGAWHSTAARAGSYLFPTAGGATVAVDDEAPFDAPPTQPVDPKGQDRFHLQQSLARWDGWSLAGRRPGKALRQDGQPAAAIGSDPRFPIEFRLKAKPGTLPLLRFGRTYRLRMRAVDLAGNAVAPADAAQVGDNDLRVSPPQAYLRHEPVGSPDVLQRETSGPGESVLRVVVRGNFDAEASGTSSRVIAPPRVAQPLAETHGLFDVGGRPAKAKYDQIAGREAARYPASGAIDLTAPVPYLPDPFARGLTLVPQDGAITGAAATASFAPGGGGAWPDLRPFGVSLQAGAAAGMSVDAGARTVRVTLTKADVATVRLSATLAPGDLPQLGLHGWLTEHFAPAPVPAALQASMLAGRYWALTPYRAVTFVYAVRQPLKAPTPFTPSPGRTRGETHARIGGSLTFSRKSTARLEMRARWSEPVDTAVKKQLPSGPGTANPDGQTTVAVAFPIPITPLPTEFSVPPDPDTLSYSGRHDFGDTKRRDVTYDVVGASRFAEYFKVQDGAYAIPKTGSPVALSGQGIEPGSVTVSSQDGKTAFAEGTAFTVDPGAGTVTFKAPLTAGTVVRLAYLPSISRRTAPADARTVVVRSSARPAAPDVVEAVPIFRWTTSTPGKDAKRSTRSPSAIRVLLGRPWWSSGVGECLGVLTWPGAAGTGTGPIPSDVAPYVSDWGADPVWGGRPLPHFHPRQATFTNAPAALRRTGLSIDEQPDLLVDVAGHAVKYDPQRELWYADIALDVGPAYTPMVRLALVRYQPESIADAHLSQVVLLDIQQVTPGRVLTVVRPNKTTIKQVNLSGQSYAKGAYAVEGPGRALLSIEKKDTAFADPELGWRRILQRTMTANIDKDGKALWTTGEIKLPPRGTFRLVVKQYELARTDKRPAPARPKLTKTQPALRLVHHDVMAL